MDDGLAVFVNSKWCNLGHVTTEVITCTRDVKLLAVGLRPYYLPQFVTDSISFCEDSVVPTSKVHCFPNSKPWINRDIVVLLNLKRSAFMARDNEDAQKEIQ